MRYSPMWDCVLIQPDSKEWRTKGGIILPLTGAMGTEKRIHAAKVLKVGPGRLDGDGKTLPMHVKEGQRVLFNYLAGYEISYKDEHAWMIRESDIYAIIDDDEDEEKAVA